jgi:hypothetical protein
MPDDRPPRDHSIEAIIRRNAVPREPNAKWGWKELKWRQVGAVVAVVSAAKLGLAAAVEGAIYESGVLPAIAIGLALGIGLAYSASRSRARS